jgi:hypothetical protein
MLTVLWLRLHHIGMYLAHARVVEHAEKLVEGGEQGHGYGWRDVLESCP